MLPLLMLRTFPEPYQLTPAPPNSLAYLPQRPPSSPTPLQLNLDLTPSAARNSLTPPNGTRGVLGGLRWECLEAWRVLREQGEEVRCRGFDGRAGGRWKGRRERVRISSSAQHRDEWPLESRTVSTEHSCGSSVDQTLLPFILVRLPSQLASQARLLVTSIEL